MLDIVDIHITGTSLRISNPVSILHVNKMRMPINLYRRTPRDRDTRLVWRGSNPLTGGKSTQRFSRSRVSRPGTAYLLNRRLERPGRLISSHALACGKNETSVPERLHAHHAPTVHRSAAMRRVWSSKRMPSCQPGTTNACACRFSRNGPNMCRDTAPLEYTTMITTKWSSTRPLGQNYTWATYSATMRTKNIPTRASWDVM